MELFRPKIKEKTRKRPSEYQIYSLSFVMSLVADITKTKEKSFLHEGKFYRWFSSAEFSEHVKTTVEHSRQLLIKTVKKNLVEKRKIAGVQHMLFALKEYEGYSADGDYFVKND